MISRLVNRLTILPRWIIIFIDLAVFICAFSLAFLLRFNFRIDDIDGSHFGFALMFAAVCGLTATLVTETYKGIVRYTGLEDGMRILYTCLLFTGMLSLLNLVWFYNDRTNLVPFSVLIIAFLAAFILLFFYRLFVKSLFQYYRHGSAEAVPVAIFGTASTGVITSHIIDTGTRGYYKTVAFFDENPDRQGKQINGIIIYDFTTDFIRVVESFGIRELILTGRDLTFDRKNSIVDICLKANVRIKSIPPVENWVHGELSINQIRDISLEDLLGRESIQMPNGILTDSIASSVICVTGAAGSIGSELCRQILSHGPATLVLIDQAESALYDLELELLPVRGHTRLAFFVADVTDGDRISRIFAEVRPDTVYHAAAYKHVPMMEKNPTEAIQTNILGSRILADLSVKFHVRRFIMVSTDKAINPTSVMGCTKRIAEIYVQALDRHQRTVGGVTQFITTRFGNVLGSSGSVVPIFRRQISQGGPITVTHPEVTRYFMSIPEACRLVLEAGVMGEGGEIFLFDMGKPVRILDLARKMIKLSGLEPDRDIRITFTGLREGEKLFEELLHHSENTLPTHHQKILKARVQEYNYQDVVLMVDLFEDLISDRNELKMIALMKELVPEFKSSYGKYRVVEG